MAFKPRVFEDFTPDQKHRSPIQNKLWFGDKRVQVQPVTIMPIWSLKLSDLKFCKKSFVFHANYNNGRKVEDNTNSYLLHKKIIRSSVYEIMFVLFIYDDHLIIFQCSHTVDIAFGTTLQEI